FAATSMTVEFNLQSPLAGLLRAEPDTRAQSVAPGDGRPKQGAPARPRHARRMPAPVTALRTVVTIERPSPPLSPHRTHGAKPRVIQTLHKNRRCCLPRAVTR